MDMNQQLLFSIIGAVDGLLITNLLRSQGVALHLMRMKIKRLWNEYRLLVNKKQEKQKLKTNQLLLY